MSFILHHTPNGEPKHSYQTIVDAYVSKCVGPPQVSFVVQRHVLKPMRLPDLNRNRVRSMKDRLLDVYFSSGKYAILIIPNISCRQRKRFQAENLE